jgi:hypothetical protein
MPIRARVTDLKANAAASLMRMDSLVAEIYRSLDLIDARILRLKVIRKASFMRALKPHHHS